ncbi:hypothetical protein C8J57DRAFT_1533201 [Mycena rebaudengoi]|nr:hypothetical protein C8J57DRAFT_1533201 [Mycena rebaudengoi]
MSCLGFYIEYMFLCLGDTLYPGGAVRLGGPACFENRSLGLPPATAPPLSLLGPTLRPCDAVVAPLRQPGSITASSPALFSSARRDSWPVWLTTLHSCGAPHGRIHLDYRGFWSCGLIDDVAAVAVMLVSVVTDIGRKVDARVPTPTLKSHSQAPWRAPLPFPPARVVGRGLTQASRAPNSFALNENGAIRVLNSASASFNELKISIPYQPQLYISSSGLRRRRQETRPASDPRSRSLRGLCPPELEESKSSASMFITTRPPVPVPLYKY